MFFCSLLIRNGLFLSTHEAIRYGSMCCCCVGASGVVSALYLYVVD